MRYKNNSLCARDKIKIMAGRVFVQAWREKGSPAKHQQTLDGALRKKSSRGNGLRGAAFSSRNYIQALTSLLRKEIFPTTTQLQLGWSWRKEQNCSEWSSQSFFLQSEFHLQKNC